MAFSCFPFRRVRARSQSGPDPKAWQRPVAGIATTAVSLCWVSADARRRRARRQRPATKAGVFPPRSRARDGELAQGDRRCGLHGIALNCGSSGTARIRRKSKRHCSKLVAARASRRRNAHTRSCSQLTRGCGAAMRAAPDGASLPRLTSIDGSRSGPSTTTARAGSTRTHGPEAELRSRWSGTAPSRARTAGRYAGVSYRRHSRTVGGRGRAAPARAADLRVFREPRAAARLDAAAADQLWVGARGAFRLF